MKQTNITHTEKDGIRYPDLGLPDMEQKPFGKYGHMRFEYLKKHCRGTYTTLLTEGKLNEHLCQIDTEAREPVKRMCKDLAFIVSSIPRRSTFDTSEHSVSVPSVRFCV